MNLRRLPLGPVLLAAVAVAHLGSVMRAPADPEQGFVYDDEAVVLLNRENLADAGTVWGFLGRPEAFTGAKGNAMFRPVAHASHVLDYHLWEFRPAGWRLTNVLLHAAASCALFLLLLRILSGWGLGDPFGDRRPGGAATAAFLGALWFGLQPVNSEVVNYVTARSESLAALFFLLALLAHHAAWEEGVARGRRAALVAASLLAAALSFGAKETGLLLPAVAAALEIWARPGGALWPGRLRGAALRCLPLVAALSGTLVLRKVALGSAAVDLSARAAMAGAGIDPMVGGGRSLLAHLLTQARVVADCGLLLLFPVDLAPDHGVRVAAALDLPTAAALLLLASAAALVAWRAVRGGRALPLAAAWAAAALAPSVLVPLNVLMNEHRLYLPATGLSLLAGLGLLALLRRAARAGPGLPLAAGVGVIGLFSGLLMVDRDRARAWSDPFALWGEAAETSPTSWRNRMHLGVEYYRLAERIFADAAAGDQVGRVLGERSGEGCLDRAREEFEASLALYPGAFETRLNLGFFHLYRGRLANRETHPDEPPKVPEEFREAIRCFTLAEQASPGSFRALYNRATAMAEAGMVAEATREFERLSQDTSRTTMYAYPLADLYRRAGRTDDALAQFDHIVQVSPADEGTAVLKRGEALTQAARFSEAEAALRRAAALLGPSDPGPPLYMARLLVGTGLPENLPAARTLWDAALARGHRQGPKDRKVLRALGLTR